MDPHPPPLQKSPAADRIAYEQSKSEADKAVPGAGHLSERLRLALGLVPRTRPN